MESRIADSRIVGTFIWTIKNFSRWFEQRDASSQSFIQDSLLSSTFTFNLFKHHWFLLSVCKKEGDPNISFGIASFRETGEEEEIKADFELSLLASDGNVLIGKRAQQPLLGIIPVEIHSANGDEAFVARKGEFLPNDTLTVRCRIWMNTGNRIEKPSVCFGLSEILLENGSSVLNVEKFSSLKAGQKRIIDLDPNILALSPLKVSIYLADNGDDVQIEIAYSDKSSIRILLEISALDCFGNVFNSSTEDFLIKTGGHHQFTDFLSRSGFAHIKSFYFANDTLFLRCRYRILYVGEIQYGCPFYKDSVAHEKVTSDPSREREKNGSAFSLPLFKDMAELFENGILSDVNIRVDTDIFPAHKVVLSARSPVFKRMFTTSLKYASDIEVPDFDADTVRMMLKYIYTDVVEDLQWYTATRLYLAAIEYELFLLKDKCSSFLKANLSNVNVCKALILADSQRDDDLKNEIRFFVNRRRREIMHSKEWKQLKTNHKQLAFETMEFMCLSKPQNK